MALSSQELRQVLNRGDFGDYLIEITNNTNILHNAMGLKEPDTRLRDVEIILRVFSFYLYAADYKGNLRRFLDDSMHKVTKDWTNMETVIRDLYEKMNTSVQLLGEVFGDIKFVGRKYKNGSFETRFNKALFEVEVFYFMHLDNTILSQKEAFISAFKKLSSDDTDFMASIESSTKNMENYKVRYNRIEQLINNTFHLELNINPFT